MKKTLLLIGFLLLYFSAPVFSQNKDDKEIEYTSERTVKNEDKYPGALIMYKVDNQVTFKHEGIKVWCDQAIFYKKDNFFRASGNVKMVQGDTIQMTSDYAEYDGATEFAFASQNVRLKTKTTTLTTDSLFFDRQKQEAFYRSGGTVKDTASTIKSRIGRYYMNNKKYSFLNNVVVTNKEYTIHSNHLDFYTETGLAYLYGPSTIEGDKSTVYCERGFYDTHNDLGHFVKNSTIYYENRKLQGDSIYFNRKKHFASATNNIKVTDTINGSVAWGHYAEVFREKDSVFITKKALVAKKQDQDSIFIHSDTIMVTGKPDHRIIRAFYDAKIYKKDFNGKADSIFMSEDEGITKMLGKPVVFSDLTQLTGDTIELFNNKETNKLDSLSVFNNAFLNQKDTIEGYNQIKGKMMYGLFDDNKLSEANFIKNTETIYYARDEKTNDLMGINKAVASRIRILFKDDEISSIIYLDSPENTTYRPEDLPKNARKLKGFIWRGDERISSKEALFKDDKPLDLPKIKGIPLPEKGKGFFREDKHLKNKPLLNKKSRLSPDILKNREEDSLQTEEPDKVEKSDEN